jgi:hypothetical protein
MGGVVEANTEAAAKSFHGTAGFIERLRDRATRGSLPRTGPEGNQTDGERT